MKTLVLIRHAKSDPAHLCADIDRGLNARGVHDAAAMGRKLLQRGVTPELIISSHAKRAYTTAKLLAETVKFPTGDICLEPSLYASSPEQWLTLIQGLDAHLNCVLVVGHNPEISTVVSQLARQTCRMVTAAVAELHYPATDWTRIPGLTPNSVLLDTPD